MGALPARNCQANRRRKGAQRRSLAGQAGEHSDQIMVEDREVKDVKAKLWALEGVSSLKIDIEADAASATTFHSLGDQPRVIAVVIDQRRVFAAAWGVALLIGLVGVGLTLRPFREKAAFVVVVLLASTVPLLVTTAFDEVGQVFDCAFFAGCALIAYYVVAAAMLNVYRWAQSRIPAINWLPPVTQAVTALFMTVVLTTVSGPANAQQSPPEDLTPVTVPSDAVIIPYDPENPRAQSGHGEDSRSLCEVRRALEPGSPRQADRRDATAVRICDRRHNIRSDTRHRRLPVIHRANGDRRVWRQAGRRAAAFGRAAFWNGPPSMASRHGCNLLSRSRKHLPQPRQRRPRPAECGGEANWHVVTTIAPAAPLRQGPQDRVELHVRLGLARQGGWRIVRGQLPVGPAARPHTVDSRSRARKSARRALPIEPLSKPRWPTRNSRRRWPAGGLVHLQWRPKVAEGMVDQVAYRPLAGRVRCPRRFAATDVASAP